jgi:hypothetical protein
VQETPRQHARRIAHEEVPRDEQEQDRDDEDVEDARSYFFFAGGGGGASAVAASEAMRAPQEQTMLRVAHSIFSNRPQLEQRR